MRSVVVVPVLCGLVWAQGAAQAKSLFKKGEFQRAAEAAARVAEKDPKNLDAWLVLADARLALNQPKDAWDALETAMEHHTDSIPLFLKLGETFLRIGAAEMAAQSDSTTITNFYMDAERMFKEAEQRDPKNAYAVYGQAAANHAIAGSVIGRKEKAAELVAKAIGMDPKLGKAHALQAFMLYGERKYEDAARKYAVALELDDSDPLTFVRMGHCYYALGKREEARQAYVACLKRHPDNNVPILSGLLHLANRKWTELAPFLKPAVEEAPTSFPAWYYYGYSLYVNDQLKEATAALKKAEQVKPGNANIAYWLGHIREKDNDAAGALKGYREALKRQPGHAEAVGRFEAIILARQNNIDDVEKLYEELLELAPDNGWIHNNYALILRNWAERRGGRSPNPPPATRKRLARSGQVYEIAARALPDQAQIQSDTGLLFEFYPVNRDDQKARDYFCRSLEISDYVYRDAFDGLARLCVRTGDWETLKDYAEGVIGSIERGNHAIAPVAASAPRALPNETPGLLARAKQAYAAAEAKLRGS